MSDKWIRASEIGDYLYCRRAWWLKRTRAVAPQNTGELQRGERHHQAHGRLVFQAIWTRRIAFLLLFFAVAVLAYQMVLGGF